MGPPHTWNLLFWSPDALIPNQPTTFHGLTFSFALNRPVLPGFPNLFPPLFLAVHFVSPLLPSSLCFFSEHGGFRKFLILAPKNASLSLGNLIHCHGFSFYLLSKEYTGATLIPRLSLKTPDSYFQWPAGRLHLEVPNFKIAELKVAELGLEISETRIFSPHTTARVLSEIR